MHTLHRGDDCVEFTVADERLHASERARIVAKPAIVAVANHREQASDDRRTFDLEPDWIGHYTSPPLLQYRPMLFQAE
jgi:hypothetical protein